MQIFNTLGRRKEQFKPITGKQVGLYTCGITAYFYAHIGNLRTYVFEDVLKRTLTHAGYSVRHVMNVTDVGHNAGDASETEDKVREEARKEHKTPHEIARFYTQAFLKDVTALNILMPEILCPASEHIPLMLELIERLEKKGYTYNLPSGVYFDTSRFKSYGELTGRTFKELNETQQAGARVERPDGVRNITDFTLWRTASEQEKDMVWDTKWGHGVPGWHIECSAMSMHYLGEHFDIHCGGADHIPIHHPNEIAQSEAATGKKFVNYWMHGEFLMVDGRKMAKSLLNIYTLTDLHRKGITPLGYRFFVLNNHYRSLANFTFENVKHSEDALKSVYATIGKLSAISDRGKNDEEFQKAAEALRDEFFRSAEDDLNIPVAVSRMHELLNLAKKRGTELGKRDAAQVLKILVEFDSILGLDFEKHLSTELPKGAAELIEEREQARKEKEFKRADELRNKLRDEFKVMVEDTKEGTAWYTTTSTS